MVQSGGGCPAGYGAAPSPAAGSCPVTAADASTGALAAAAVRGRGGLPPGTEPNPTYTSYLALDRVLDAQFPRSRAAGDEQHDEMLFIIVHQAYELWFKQVLHDVDSVLGIFKQPFVDDRALSLVEQRLSRVNEIFRLLADQFRVLLTMLPHQFLGFRRYLGTSSGFQSVQFRVLELKLGLRDSARVAFAHSWKSALGPDQAAAVTARTPGCPDGGGSLVECVDAWLRRMPFMEVGNFDWWREYQRAAAATFEEDMARALREAEHTGADPAALREQAKINQDDFAAIFDEEKYNQRLEYHKLSYGAFKAALFINLYRHEPVFQIPHLVLTRLIEVDEGLSNWRWRHAQMVKRIIGGKLGTGGSSGAAYLSQTASQRYRIFADLAALSTYMLPASRLPALPDKVAQAVGFVYSTEGTRSPRVFPTGGPRPRL